MCFLTDIKGLFTRNVFYLASVILFTDIRITDRIMGSSPILSVIHNVTIGTMLNNNGGKSGHGLKNVKCKQTLNHRDSFAQWYKIYVNIRTVSMVYSTWRCWWFLLWWWNKSGMTRYLRWKPSMYRCDFNTYKYILIKLHPRSVDKY